MEMYEAKVHKKRKKTPKMMEFLAYYNDPASDTYCNARGSALKAGYTESYASNLTHLSPAWMTSDAKRVKMLEKAESNLEKIVNMDIETLKNNPQMFKTWQDTVKFISERLGKEHYSTRQELTGKGGKQLFSKERQLEIEETLKGLLPEHN